MKQVFVTGGTGFIGAHLVRLLLQEGYLVVALVSPSSNCDNLRGLNIKLVTGDLHPAIEGNLNKNLGTGKGYLEWLAARDPARPGVKKSSAS